MSKLSEMPVVTVEQVSRFRDAALAVERENEQVSGYLETLTQRMLEAEQQHDELLAAAVAVVERWDTPLWKEAEHTGVTIDRLRKAIAKARG